MSKTISQTLQKNSGLVLVLTYFVLFLVNILVLYILNMIFPNNFVLGTLSLSMGWALVLSMGKLALINTLAVPFFNEYEMRRGTPLTARDWMIGYFVLNFIAIWVITRFSQQFGLGISAWYWAAVLALVLDFVQGGAMMWVEKLRVGK